jgi:hypothetical protein
LPLQCGLCACDNRDDDESQRHRRERRRIRGLGSNPDAILGMKEVTAGIRTEP